MDASHSELPPPVPELKCPKCGAGNVQGLRVLYESGSSTSRTTVAHNNNGEEALALAWPRQAGKQQTLLAQRCANPTKKPELKNKAGCMSVAVRIRAYMILAMLIMLPLQRNGEATSASNTAGFLSIIAGPALEFGSIGIIAQKNCRVFKAYNREKAIYDRVLAQWEQSYYCPRCGNIFEWASGVEPPHGF